MTTEQDHESFCDICGAPAVGCLGGTDYYCASHEQQVVDAHAQTEPQDIAEGYLGEAQEAGMVGESDWFFVDEDDSGRTFVVDFGDGRGALPYTAAEIVEKLSPEAGFFNRP